MDYGSILSRAWKITWSNKILWVFGILSALGSGGGGGGNGGGRGFGRTSGGPSGFPPNEQLQRLFGRPDVIAIVVAVVVVLIVVGLVIFALSIIGRGGLIGGVRLAEDNGKVTFGEAWGVGRRSFLRLFLLRLAVILPIIVLILAGVAAAVLTLGLGAICLVPLICLLVIALIPISILVHFAQFGIVLDDLGVMDSLRKGWAVIKANLGPILMLGVILLVIGFVAGLILALPFIIIVIPAAFAFVLGGNQPNVPLLTAAGIAFVCYLPILIFLSGVLHTWIMSAWTLAWRQFTGVQTLQRSNVPTF